MTSEEKLMAYLAVVESGGCLLRIRLPTESGLLESDSPAYDYPCSAMVYQDGFFGYWFPGVYSRPHAFRVEDVTEDMDDLTIDGVFGEDDLPIQAHLSPTHTDEHLEILREVEGYRGRVWARAQLREVIDGAIQDERITHA